MLRPSPSVPVAVFTTSTPPFRMIERGSNVDLACPKTRREASVTVKRPIFESTGLAVCSWSVRPTRS